MPNYYALQTDTYLVEGAKNHAIYDLLNGHLYSITDEVLNLVRSLLQIRNFDKKISEDNLQIIQPLIDQGIIIPYKKW